MHLYWPIRALVQRVTGKYGIRIHYYHNAFELNQVSFRPVFYCYIFSPQIFLAFLLYFLKRNNKKAKKK